MRITQCEQVYLSIIGDASILTNKIKGLGRMAVENLMKKACF